MPRLKKLTHQNVPASVGLVKEVGNELRSEIRATEHRLNSKIAAVDSKVVALDSKIVALDSKIESVAAVSEATLVAVHRTQVLMEEQRSENRIVLDGIKGLAERQERLENEMGSRRF